MLFETPALDAHEEWVLQRVTELRERLSSVVREPRRWVGVLRRVSLARAIHGSNTIEGYNVTWRSGLAAADDEEPLDAQGETWMAVTRLPRRDDLRPAAAAIHRASSGCRALVQRLHFMMLRHVLSKNPGRWRPGTQCTSGRDANGRDRVRGPGRRAMVPSLVGGAEGPTWLRDDSEPAVIRAGMAHLNLVMIHPFSDGNGRMADASSRSCWPGKGILSRHSAASRSTWAATPRRTTTCWESWERAMAPGS